MTLKTTALTVTTAGFFILASVLIAHSAIIKKTSSGICHPEDSSYYSRIKSYTTYSSLEKCIESGGRLPKSYTPPKKINTGYERSHFGHGWGDLDGDGQDTRQEILIEQSTAPVCFKSGDNHKVISGRWISPFTGNVIHDPSVMDIDHVVPLRWAWEHGAKKWTDEKREKFANDPANLLSVEASLNRQKGAKGPDEWLPPANRCEYLLRFLRIAKNYGLNGTDTIRQIRTLECK